MTGSCSHNHNHRHHGHEPDDSLKEKTKLAEVLAERLGSLRMGDNSGKGKSLLDDDSWMRNIQKRLLHVGTGFPLADSCQRAGGGYEYPPETKFMFHYQIKTVEPEGAEVVVMDDTKKYGKTMELYSGKKFQLEFWEYCLSTMALNEVAVFRVPPERLLNFAPVNKKLRDYMLNKTATGQATHCCGGMLAMQEGALGYDDLNEFLRKPRTLDFVFELLSVELPEENKKETWILNPEERAAKVPELREQGNSFYIASNFEAAANCYKQALGLLEQLALREKPHEPEWEEIDSQRIPFFVNLAQCQFKLKEFYGAIESTTEALSRDHKSVKALYRRAQSYAQIWEIEKALKDYQQVIDLDPKMRQSVECEMTQLRDKWKAQLDQEKNLLSARLKMSNLKNSQ